MESDRGDDCYETLDKTQDSLYTPDVTLEHPGQDGAGLRGQVSIRRTWQLREQSRKGNRTAVRHSYFEQD